MVPSLEPAIVIQIPVIEVARLVHVNPPSLLVTISCAMPSAVTPEGLPMEAASQMPSLDMTREVHGAVPTVRTGGEIEGTGGGGLGGRGRGRRGGLGGSGFGAGGLGDGGFGWGGVGGGGLGAGGLGRGGLGGGGLAGRGGGQG